MKLQLDTVAKTVKVEGTVNLKEFYDTLTKLLPDGQWKEYTLEANTTIVNWQNPVVIDRWHPAPYYPWYGSPIYCSSSTTNADNLLNTSTQGTYCLEVSL
jgi:hypothetical protein